MRIPREFDFGVLNFVFQRLPGVPPDLRLHLPIPILDRHQGGEGKASHGLQERAEQEGVQVLQARPGESFNLG